MKASEIKKMLIRSLDPDADTRAFPEKLEEAGISPDFSYGFSDKVLDRLSHAVSASLPQAEFIKGMNYVFYRIALTGVAAIVILLISIFLMEGSLSFNSFIGLSDTYDESIVCLLTGN
ncbi:MAG: hypothetical protein K0B05_02060 [Bacteroidales bacterium]|nr:hypothetical protein [Bacteroidales bacterium]